MLRFLKNHFRPVLLFSFLFLMSSVVYLSLSRVYPIHVMDWGYVRNLTLDRHETDLPLLMDGGMLGDAGRWTVDLFAPGGIRRGKKAIVARICGSIKLLELTSGGLAKEKKDESMCDIFGLEFGSRPENCLNPLSK